jgi:excinuclease UvrABC ATPase subunit
MTSESMIRGYKAGRFSFNVGGRCENHEGSGVRTIEMNFLPDVYVECGKRKENALMRNIRLIQRKIHFGCVEYDG